MKMKQKLVAGAALLSAAAGFTAPAHSAEVAATVGASNMYYWRGFDLGGGAALIADVNVKESGAYAGLWASSGDELYGTEWDFYAGYGFSAGPLSVDLNYTTYMYPTPKLGFDDLSDAAITLGLKASDDLSFSAMYRQGLGDVLGDDNYTYATLSATYSKFTALVGMHSDDSKTYDGVTHLDLKYAYNDKLSFTIGKIIDLGETEDTPKEANDEVKFVVNLSLPIE